MASQMISLNCFIRLQVNFSRRKSTAKTPAAKRGKSSAHASDLLSSPRALINFIVTRVDGKSGSRNHCTQQPDSIDCGPREGIHIRAYIKALFITNWICCLRFWELDLSINLDSQPPGFLVHSKSWTQLAGKQVWKLFRLVQTEATTSLCPMRAAFHSLFGQFPRSLAALGCIPNASIVGQLISTAWNYPALQRRDGGKWGWFFFGGRRCVHNNYWGLGKYDCTIAYTICSDSE